jgi:hypothetical protein
MAGERQEDTVRQCQREVSTNHETQNEFDKSGSNDRRDKKIPKGAEENSEIGREETKARVSDQTKADTPGTAERSRPKESGTRTQK